MSNGSAMLSDDDQPLVAKSATNGFNQATNSNGNGHVNNAHESSLSEDDEDDTPLVSISQLSRFLLNLSFSSHRPHAPAPARQLFVVPVRSSAKRRYTPNRLHRVKTEPLSPPHPPSMHDRRPSLCLVPSPPPLSPQRARKRRRTVKPGSTTTATTRHRRKTETASDHPRKR